MQSVLRFKGGAFHPNFDLNRDLRRQHVLDDELDRLAKLGALGAREIAVKVAWESGDYFRSIHGGLGTNRKGLTVGRISADDFKANWLEKGFRTIRGQGTGGRGSRTRIRQLTGEPTLGFVPGKKVLARGARRAGLRVRLPKRR